MKKTTLLLISISFFISSAQTLEERKKIIKNYDIDAIEKLEIRLKNENEKVEESINKFLKENKTFKRVIRSGNKNYHLARIIDGRPVYQTTDNVNSAKATRTNFLHSGGGLGINLEGQDMFIGIWDEGIARMTHYEFRESDTSTTSRVENGDGGSIDSHGTHVAGTMVGRGYRDNAKGMAPQAQLVSYNWSNDYTEVLNQARFGGLLISNHSYGFPVRDPDTNEQNSPTWLMGCYDSDAANWDNIPYLAPYYLQVVSAGNDGESSYSGGLLSGFDKLTAEKNAKNNLVVANANNPFVINGNVISLSINDSSSQGPSDDGRIKPDIAGDGTQLYSADSGNDLAYSVSTGTSMAAPNVSGSLLLLQQYYNQLNGSFMKSATLKGLACHTASEDGTRFGPDPIFGWGLLNSKFAAETILAASSEDALITESSVNIGETYTVSFDVSAGEPLSATLCWTDPPGTSRNGQLNSPQPALVNDLDLRIYSPDGNNIYFPWKLDLNDISGLATTGDNLVDTVENIDVDNPISGTYTLTVTHKGGVDTSDQDFSLIVTGAGMVLGFNNNTLSEIKVWPNPANDIINFKFPSQNSKPALLSLYDIQGRQVHKKTISSRNSTTRGQIKTTSLARGIYVLKIKQGNASMQQKIVLK